MSQDKAASLTWSTSELTGGHASDIVVSREEISTLNLSIRKDKCMRIPTSVYKPVSCRSKAGLASQALFIGIEAHLPKDSVEDPVNVPAPRRPSDAKTLKEYALVYKNLSKEQKATVDSADIPKGRGSVLWTRPDQDSPAPLSYSTRITPKSRPSFTPPTQVNASKETPSSTSTNAAPKATTNSNEEPATAAAARTRARPESASAAFRSVTRDQAQRASIRTGSIGSGPEMAPGKYNPSLSCSTKHTPTPIIRAISTPAAVSVTARPISADPFQAYAQTVPPEDASPLLRPASALPSYYGLSSFRASKRRPMESNSAASHLATAYYSEGYDSGLSSSKSVKLVTSFTTQVLHKPLLANSDSPAALGPGAYGTPPIPSEISAGHKQAKLKGALPFSKQVTRPGSAPPASVDAHRNGREGKRSERKSIEEEIYGPGLRALREGGLDENVIYEDEEEGLEGDEEKWSPREPRADQARSIAPLGFEEIQKFTSYGFAKKVTGAGKFPKTSRAVETQGLRAMSRNGVIPPASGPLRLGAGADAFYDPKDEAQGHRKRASSARLPPNRYAGSTGWITSAALAYL